MRDRKRLLAAEAARDAGHWQVAADLFEVFLAGHPHRNDIRIQFGNCAKECGRYAKAYEAFRLARGSAYGRDAELQIGHLFKVTGNFGAARAAFERAKGLGDTDAAAEHEAYGPSWLSHVRLAAADEERPLPPDSLTDVLAADFDPEPNPQRLRDLGRLAMSLGDTTIAKAFHELAFLSSASPHKRRDEIRIAVRTGLWSPDHIMTMKRTARKRERHSPPDVRDRLRVLIAAASAEPLGDEGRAPPGAKFPALAATSPMALDQDSAQPVLARLAAAITGAYEALAHDDGCNAAAFVDAVRDLRQQVHPILGMVALTPSFGSGSFRIHATRILRDRAAVWIARIEDAYLGSRVTPALRDAFLALGSNPLAERLVFHGSPAGLFDEMTAIMVGLQVSPETHDRVLARLLTVTAPDLSVDEVRSLFDEALRRHVLAAAVALVERQMADASVEIVEIASRFKQAGEPHHARALLERHLHEGSASLSARIEKALVAKTCGDFATAARILEACASERPDDAFVRRELIAVLPEREPIETILARFRHDALFLRLAGERQAYRLRMPTPEEGERIGMAVVADGLRVVDLAPELATELLPSQDEEEREGIELIQVGWLTKRGPGLGETRPLLRRHDFVRTRTAYREPIVRLRLRIDGRTVGTTTGVPLPSGSPSGSLQPLMFNCWIDLSEVSEGPHELQLYFEEVGGGYRTFELLVWVDPSPPAAAAMESAATVDLAGDDRPGSLEDRIARQPSAVFPAARRLLDPPRRILVMRVDQLGDLVTSLPAMLRLRDCFPDAELSCLVSPNYVDVVEDLGIFAEIFTLDFPYEIRASKRHLTLPRQAALRRELGARGFDLAIDLCFGHMSRPLLRLVQARFTAGFWPQEFPWLDFGIDVRSRDVVNGRYRLPQQAVCTMLVDGLAALVRHTAVHRPRVGADWAELDPFGVPRDGSFVVLHTGGRTPSRKWPIPHFVALARLLVERRGLRVIVIADTPLDFNAGHRKILAQDDVRLIDHRLPFADLDTLLSLCTVFVGNDSGPKHLAAFRGTPVVSIHAGALNWNDWGQDGVGRIVVHRVPCFGCGIELAEECGKGLACLSDITPEDVFGAVADELLQAQAGDGDDTVTPELSC